MKRIILSVTGLLLLAGCQGSGGSAAVRALPETLAGSSRIASVRVEQAQTSQGIGDEFKTAFAAHVQDQLNECATGPTPLSLQITLDNFEGANPGLALLFPNQSRISGDARLLDASGAVVGEYRIERSLTAGGLAGAVMATQAQSNMSKAFGDELCKQAFPRRRR